jgi:hypothetical protein
MHSSAFAEPRYTRAQLPTSGSCAVRSGKGGDGSPGCRAQGYAMLPEGDAGAVMEALYSRGPLAVSLDASHDSFRFYASGATGRPGPCSRGLPHVVAGPRRSMSDTAV